MSKKRLGEILLERGVIDQTLLDQALQLQKLKGIRLGEALTRHLQVPKEEIAKAMEQIQGVPYAECPPPFISESVLERIPRAVAMKCCALPLQIQNNVLVIAMAEPQNLKMLDELRFCSGKQVSPRFSFREDILAGIRRYYDGESNGNLVLKSDFSLTSELVLKTDLFAKSNPPTVAQEAATKSPAAEAAETPDDNNGAPCGNTDEKDASRAIEFVSANSSEEALPALRLFDPFTKETPAPLRLLSRMMARAANEDATELHVEPCRSGAAVRMRVAGSLSELPPITAEDLSSIVSYLKTLASMDDAERRIPQEGGFCIVHEERRFDIRVSTLPVHFGEKILLRILDPYRGAIALGQLGLPAPQQAALQRFLDRGQGALIIAGPAGSGKSTLLNASLNHVRSASRNIISVEDPVEQVLEGVTQVRAERCCGLRFPTMWNWRSASDRMSSSLTNSEIRKRRNWHCARRREARSYSQRLTPTTHPTCFAV
jgi:type II secretory ATPase GspE/PulE/Tfp pilus assembly ATPase PilB-like protein